MRPSPLDPESAGRVEQTFLVVRIVRGSLLAVFLALALAGVQAKEWPGGIALGVAVVLGIQVAAIGMSVRRYVALRAALREDR